MTESIQNSAPLAELKDRVESAFTTRFGSAPLICAAAPGRVNVIGEHVDYNGGLVLPAAIERWVVAAARPGGDALISLHDVRSGERLSFPAADLEVPATRGLGSYVKGVLRGLRDRGHQIGGLELSFLSTIPIGGGLSSSAALEAVIATVVARLRQIPISPFEMAKLCQKAEQDYAGVPCGLMDQAAVILSREGHLLLLDCESERVRFHPFGDPGWQLMIVNSGVSHDLAASEYCHRRAACHHAAQLLGVSSLRHVSIPDLERALVRPQLTDEMRRCVRHVVTEIDRTRATVIALSAADYGRVGQLLRASHESLRVDYRVSCPELDFIVDTACRLEGVAGCRITGGGFGGSAIALVQTASVAAAKTRIESAYRKRFSKPPQIFCTTAVAGAAVL